MPLKKHLKFKQKNVFSGIKAKIAALVSCIGSIDGLSWIAKIKSWIKGHHLYNYKYTIAKKTQISKRESQKTSKMYMSCQFNQRKPIKQWKFDTFQMLWLKQLIEWFESGGIFNWSIKVDKNRKTGFQQREQVCLVVEFRFPTFIFCMDEGSWKWCMRLNKTTWNISDFLNNTSNHLTQLNPCL